MPEEPAAKRQRVSDFVLQPEDEFMAAHSGTSKIMVQVPEVEGNEVLQGQVLAVEVAGLTDSLGTFKARLAEVLKQPANRLQLSREGVGFLKDQFSLGFYNVSEEIQLQLSIRQRGGRK
jgi:splicing factor 3A subunit 1